MRPNSSHTGKRRRNRGRGNTTPPTLNHENREACEEAIGYRFKDAALLDRAMTHRSAVSGKPDDWSNERLEFLGDRVLGLVVVEALFERFPKVREGLLAPRLNSVVSRETCGIIGAELQLDRFLIVDKAERSTGGPAKPSLLANAMEAVLGAVYLDGGLVAAQRFVRSHWKTALAQTETLERDPKSLLQEWAQGRGKPTPSYELLKRSGPDHAPIFETRVAVQKVGEAIGKGASKQDAEREAAKALLDKIGPNKND